MLLKQVFGLTNINVQKFANLTITKSEFTILFNEALDEYNEMIASATY